MIVTLRSPAFILDAIHDESDADGRQALLSSAASVRDAGFTPPSWDDLATGTAEEEAQHGEVEPNQPRHGWHSRAVREVESRSLHAIREVLPIPQQALLRSQGGPLASAPFVCMPVDRVFRIDSQPFRILLLRRLWMPLPLTVHSCRCGRLLDCLGHHRSACAVVGVLGRRGGFLSKTQQRAFVERRVAGRARTSWSEIKISTPSTTLIRVVSRLWLTACPSSEGHSWPSTPPW